MKLIASSATEAGLLNLAKRYFFNPDLTMIESSLFKKSGEALKGFIIIKKGRRYRLERIE